MLIQLILTGTALAARVALPGPLRALGRSSDSGGAARGRLAARLGPPAPSGGAGGLGAGAYRWAGLRTEARLKNTIEVIVKFATS